MKAALKIHLRKYENVFVNGAVLRADRKVTLELLNDVVFLLESHVMQPEDAQTPLRQLYFITQSILMEPDTASFALKMYEDSYSRLCETFENEEVVAGLHRVNGLMNANRVFEALKQLRTLFSIEDKILRMEKAEAAA